ncbi:MAG: glycosyltransferase family 4 protein [Aliidiomarina sp.]|uniref:glycosyltransferase family 4 protein n=1 Tax=Aliidiomarina sp. TaxID=1872439 RepID=UPI0025BF3CFD|nr:glycosyltransferase family 4 protein [Aliidiomarina sp.]MCH8502367.1 glycosyltransferase family 4 protein [Aliidiomarina sp.]
MAKMHQNGALTRKTEFMQSSMHNHENERIAFVGNEDTTLIGFRGELIRDLVNQGHTVYAFCTQFSDNSREKIEALGAIPVQYNMSKFSLNPLRDMFTLFQLYKFFKRLEITITYCYFAKPVIYGTLAAAMARVPKRIAKIEGLGRVFTETQEGTSVSTSILRWGMVRLYKLALPKSSLLLLLNNEDKWDLIDRHNISVPRSEVIGGIGVCLDAYPKSQAPKGPLRFIFVGRLLAEKGIRYFLQAAEVIKKQHPEVEFIVLGEPDGRAGREKAVSRPELMDYVSRGVITYPGRVNNVVDWLASSSVFVLPSYYREGVPRSTQEALAVGRAVITTDMPGCRETVIHGDNGLLIPPHDQLALVRAIEHFIHNPEDVDIMGSRGRELAKQKFDVRACNDKILSLIHGLPSARAQQAYESDQTENSKLDAETSETKSEVKDAQ